MAEINSELFCWQSDETGEWQSIAQNAWDKMKIARFKDGFVDGKYLSEEKALQSGFNEGYQAGFQTSYKVAVLKGIVGAVATNLKESNPNYLEDVEKLNKEIAELEKNCLEMKKSIVMPKDTHSADPLPLDCTNDDDDNDFTHPNPSSTFNDKESCIMNSLKIEKQFNALKENAVKLLEECGYASLTEHITKI